MSRAIHNLGGESLAIYTAGGPTGDLLRALLEKEGVCQEPIPVKAWTRENLYVLEDATRHHYRFVMPGAALEETEWQRCLERLSRLPAKAGYLVASGSLPPGVPEDFLARVVRVARQLGTRFVLDTAQPGLGPALREGRVPREAESARAVRTNRAGVARRTATVGGGRGFDPQRPVRGCCAVPGGGGCLAGDSRGDRVATGRRLCACGAWWERATACWPGSSSAWPGAWRCGQPSATAWLPAPLPR